VAEGVGVAVLDCVKGMYDQTPAATATAVGERGGEGW
jgi:hypothetical protein